MDAAARPTARRVAALLTTALLGLTACSDDDADPGDPGGVENTEEVDAGDTGPDGTTPGGGAGTTGGSDQGNVEPDAPDDTTQGTAQDAG